MAYYVTLYNGGTLDTNIPTAGTQFYIFERFDRDGVTFLKTDPSATFRYNNGNWTWAIQSAGLQNGKEYWAITQQEYLNAIRNAAANQDYTPDGIKVRYLNDGIILLKGVYTGFPFHLEEESQAEPLSTPTGLNADNITSNSATISWNAVENATDYKVEYRRQGDTTWNE